jgi:hypothetical protein
VDDVPSNAEARTRDHAPNANPRARAGDARDAQTSLFPAER